MATETGGTGRIWKGTLITILVAFVLMQFYRPAISEGTQGLPLNAPPAVQAILQKSCYDCHSNTPHLKWFDYIAPGYWLVASDINAAQNVLNFSTMGNLDTLARNATLWEVLNQARLNAMPTASYVALHPETKITEEDIAILKKYVATLKPDIQPDSGMVAARDHQFQEWSKGYYANKQTIIAPSGVPYMDEYKDWQPISTTLREDNGTLRIIFGNDIAVKAIRENRIHPWPNGATFAKVAWDQLIDTAGNITTGAFRQVEFMIKDSKKYIATRGWGWARFKTPALVPYGKDKIFTAECINCHNPMKNNDFVFTQPIQLP
ncbi:cytochrome P460 family protein [Chitinophaga sp. Hz27]|uniref:cytochrome P460 family protein n=1 Tax=Chitinophaga sp. Hz27 TaxID=3347169 RepID=UPI0035DCDF03